MKKLVVYFHGFGSFPESSKTDRLRESLSGEYEVHAFPIDIDPEIALAELSEHIDSLLLEDMHRPDKVLFVGTSLGGWWASKLGELYDIPAIVINPSITPHTSLYKHKVSEEISLKYTPIVTSVKNEYFFGSRDKIIDSTEFRKTLDIIGAKYTVVDASHRFNGSEFELVIGKIHELLD